MRLDWWMFSFLIRLTAAFLMSREMWLLFHAREYGYAALAGSVTTLFCWWTIEAWQKLKETKPQS